MNVGAMADDRTVFACTPRQCAVRCLTIAAGENSTVGIGRLRIGARPVDDESLFRLAAGRFDDRPPLLDLRFLVGGERLRGLLLARWNRKALAGELLAKGCIAQCAHGGGIERADDVVRRASRSE